MCWFFRTYGTFLLDGELSSRPRVQLTEYDSVLSLKTFAKLIKISLNSTKGLGGVCPTRIVKVWFSVPDIKSLELRTKHYFVTIASDLSRGLIV